MSIGTYISAVRKESGLTIKDVAAMSKVAPSLISQIENDKVNPSMATMIALTRALKLDPQDLFNHAMDGGEEPESALVRGDDARSLRSFPGVEYHLLANKDFENIEFVRKVFKKGYDTEHDPANLLRHNYTGYEFALVISGKLQITVEGEVYVLTPGDSICYAAEKKHSVKNLVNGDSSAVWLNIKQHLGEAPPDGDPRPSPEAGGA